MQFLSVYKWKFLLCITCLYMFLIILSALLLQTGWKTSPISTWLSGHYELLSPPTYLSTALVMQHFKEAAWKSIACYLLVAELLLFAPGIGMHLNAGEKVVLSAAPSLFYLISIFSVKAPDVSLQFKWLGWIFIVTVVAVVFFGFMHLYVKYFNASFLVLKLFQEASVTVILILLLKMIRLEAQGPTSIEREIEAIGSTVEE